MQGRCELAIAAATYALKIGTSMYGEGKLELVPAYLQLAEANLGLLQYRQAEEYLSQSVSHYQPLPRSIGSLGRVHHPMKGWSAFHTQ